MTRKDFIASSALAAAGFASPLFSFANVRHPQTAMKVCLFSKQLQWLNYADMASAVAEMGYDGIDLTVRANGHVLPERVTEDLPKAVDAAKKAGIQILMISTDIQDASQPITEPIVKTAAALGIQYYRTGGLNYQKDLDIPANLEMIKAKFRGLADLNKQYGLHSDYLNHSGEGFGASMWDLWLTLKDLDPKYVGSQFDIKHSTIDGPFSWPVSLKLIHSYVKTFCVRDFRWEEKSGKWDINPVPLGEGMVDFKKYFSLVKQYSVSGPITVMCDYDLGGAENGAKTLKVPGKNVLDAMRKDLLTLKGHLKAASL